MTPSRRKGTVWENAVVTFLQESGWPYAERRALHGNQDRGDIAGVAGACIEAKSASKVELAEWLKEMQAEKENAKANLGVVWFKRRGKTSAGDGYVLMDGHQFVQLIREAGYQ